MKDSITILSEIRKLLEDFPQDIPVISAPISLKEAIAQDELRIHMSKKPVTSIRPAGSQELGFKPKGFWYGCGSEWLDFAETEFPEARGDYLYQVTLKPSANILFIRNLWGLDAFHEKYAVGDKESPRLVVVDWPRVAKEYDGIEICPYQWKRRLAKNFLWYYGWDVASGCIWNSSAIKELTPIKREDVPDAEKQAVSEESSKPVVYMPIAPSGAGKTTYFRKLKAKDPKLQQFSLDALRHEFYDPKDYDRAFQMSTEDPEFPEKANARFLSMLDGRTSIFVDATNLTPERRDFYLKAAKKEGYRTVGIVLPYDLDVLIARQKTRGDKSVPEPAVRRQAGELVGPQEGEFDEVIALESSEIQQEAVSTSQEYWIDSAGHLTDASDGDHEPVALRTMFDDDEEMIEWVVKDFKGTAPKQAKNYKIQIDYIKKNPLKVRFATEYMMEKEDWIRMQGANFQLYSVDQSKLKHIADALWEVSSEGEDIGPDETGMIEDVKTKRTYEVNLKALLDEPSLSLLR